MKKAISALALASVFTCLSFSVFAQTSGIGGTLNIPTTASFEKLKVTQESVFQGKVFFDNGLSLNGDARFLNNIVGDGDLQIAKNVRFVGLPENPTINYIITGDVSGDLSRAPLTVLARELESTLKNLNELTVKDATTLKGQLTLADGLQISGAANFAGNVLVQNNLAVNGTLNLKGLPVLDSVPEGSLVLGIGPDGKIIILPGGPVFGWPGTPCGLYPKPAIWESSVNKLVTDKCSNDIKVGIGTQSPTERLEVSGHVRVNGAVFAGRKTAGYPTNHEFKGTMLVGGNGIGNNDNKYVSFGFDGSKTFINSSNPANEGLYINAGSNLPVIIGSNNTSLTVHGSILIKGAEGFSNYGHSAALNLGNQDHYIRSIFGRGISLSTANASDGLILDQNGRIGIATGFDNIQAKVHIKASANEPALLCEVGGNQKFMVAADGLVYAQEIKVKMAPFPDYVFKEDYHLMSLTELQTFIKQNGRLPDMPSAEQVEKEGAELGELVRKLVEKNEQLTLYILEMEKANKLLEERLKHLEEAKK